MELGRSAPMLTWASPGRAAAMVPAPVEGREVRGHRQRSPNSAAPTVAAMGRWKFAHPGTHRQFAAGDLTKLLLDGGFSCEEMCFQSVSLGMAIPGLLALAKKLAPEVNFKHRYWRRLAVGRLARAAISARPARAAWGGRCRRFHFTNCGSGGAVGGGGDPCREFDDEVDGGAVGHDV